MINIAICSRQIMVEGFIALISWRVNFRRFHFNSSMTA